MVFYLFGRVRVEGISLLLCHVGGDLRVFTVEGIIFIGEGVRPFGFGFAGRSFVLRNALDSRRFEVGAVVVLVSGRGSTSSWGRGTIPALLSVFRSARGSLSLVEACLSSCFFFPRC